MNLLKLLRQSTVYEPAFSIISQNAFFFLRFFWGGGGVIGAYANKCDFMVFTNRYFSIKNINYSLKWKIIDRGRT